MFKWNLNRRVRALQYFAHIPVAYGFYHIFTTGEYYWLLVAAITTLVVGISINVGIHRLITHRSFETHSWVEKTLSFIFILSSLGPPLAWAAAHRMHHAEADNDNDPYPGSNRLNTLLGWHMDADVPLKYFDDLMRDDFQRMLLKNYFKLLFGIVIILMLIDPILTIFTYFWATVHAFYGTGSIAVVTHGMHGYRNFDTPDKSTNSWIAHIISMGEGWHNNHHKYPMNWNNRQKWWEIDPNAWFIRLIKK